MVMESTDGEMVQPTKVRGLRTTSTAQALTSGLMGVSTLGNGKITNSMGEESTLGLMADAMKESMLMIRKKDMVFTFGLMVGNTKANGVEASNMEKASLQTARERARWAYGQMVSASNG